MQFGQIERECFDSDLWCLCQLKVHSKADAIAVHLKEQLPQPFTVYVSADVEADTTISVRFQQEFPLVESCGSVSNSPLE